VSGSLSASVPESVTAFAVLASVVTVWFVATGSRL